MPAKSRRRFPLARVVTVGMVGLAVFFSWRLVADAAFFKVSQIEVVGDPTSAVSPQIRNLALGQNLIFFPEAQIRNQVKTNKTVSTISFEKKFPAGIVAKVSFRQGIVTWQSAAGRFLVDGEGVAYQVAGSEPLPQASDPTSTVKLGDQLPASQIDLISRILAAAEGKFNVLTIGVGSSEVRIQLSNGAEVVLNPQQNLAQEEETLQLILGQAKIEGRTPRQIDLRYQKPIINY